MTIGITGATGQLGRLVLQSLRSRGTAEPVVALVRSPEKAADLGVEARAFDYSAPETLAASLAGIDTLLLISSSEVGKRAEQHRNVIEAAKAAGVKRIVYTSLLHADTSPLGLAGEHKATEEMLKASGIPHTILRNGWYAENHTGSIGPALAHGAFIGSAGEGRISAAPRADYAEAAAVVLATPGHEGRTYELAGDEAFTLGDLAAELSRQSGRTIPYVNLSEGDYTEALRKAGLPDALAAGIAGWDADASRGALHEEGRALSGLIGRPTGSLAESVAAALKG